MGSVPISDMRHQAPPFREAVKLTVSKQRIGLRIHHNGNGMGTCSGYFLALSVVNSGPFQCVKTISVEMKNPGIYSQGLNRNAR